MDDIIRGGDTRQNVWLAAWLTVARAEGSRFPDVATKWADACLKAFDERFKQPNAIVAQPEQPGAHKSWLPS